jgi:tripartite-type tricarboxylate transporter receptor subunit TctC
MTNWYGMLVPNKTPRDVIIRLNAEVARILKLPELRNRLADDGMTVVASTPGEFAEFFAREVAKLARVIEGAGIKGTL